MTSRVNNLPTRSVNPKMEQTNEYPLTKITLWKRYAPLSRILCSNTFGTHLHNYMIGNFNKNRNIMINWHIEIKN